MEVEKYRHILQKLEEYDRYLITAHPTPDGDALGSCLAFYYSLKKAGKQVTLMVHGYLEHKYKFLLEGVEYSVFPENLEKPFQCVIILDVGDKKRVQEILERVAHQNPYLINIDHHASNRGFAQIDLVEASASSSGEIVYHLFQEGNLEIPPEIATALYAAIATDTGFFTYSNTTSSALKDASELLALGADLATISDKVIRSKPISMFQLEAEYLASLKFTSQSKIVWGEVSRELCHKYNVPLFEVGSFVEIPRNLEGIGVSVLFRETEEGKNIKLSLRSNDSDLDMNLFANQFGGGGHSRAAGSVLEGELHSTAEKVMQALKEYYFEMKKNEP